ncbi:MAG: molybdenum cofactor cytidylyltransferase [Anaerolineales bacterium]
MPADFQFEARIYPAHHERQATQEMISSLSLSRAFRLSPATTLALVGAGGKTTALFQLGKEFQQTSPLVLLTTTTHLGPEQPTAADVHLIHKGNLTQTLQQIHSTQGIVCLTSAWDDRTERWSGLDRETLQGIAHYAREHTIPLIIEADGARGRCLKAPAEHEPVIPPFCETVIVVAGLGALGKPLNETWVHRPERFAALSGSTIGEPIQSEAVLRLLCHPMGGRKGIPVAAKSHLLLTQAETNEAQAVANRMSLSLLDHFDSIAIAAKGEAFALPSHEMMASPCPTPDFRQPFHLLAVHEPIAGIILAAGASSRFGQPKPLLAWRGETLVHRAARLALEADLQPVLVVCGADGAQVAASVADLPVQIVQNEAWQSGQSSSIKAALQVLGNKCGGAIFILADQPFISIPLLQALVENHAKSLAAVIAPLVGDRRTNPVLFDRQTFPDLLHLEGDVGGRAIFGRFPPQWLTWHDERLPFDLDTPEDYRKLREMDEHHQ